MSDSGFQSGWRAQALRFGISGLLGLGVDTLALHGLLGLGLGFAWARALSFLVAATFTWLFNRRHTFVREQPVAPSLREWLRYLSAMAVGGVVNYGVSLWAYQASEVVRAWPVIALALGSGAGMVFNFLSARYLVFRAPR